MNEQLLDYSNQFRSMGIGEGAQRLRFPPGIRPRQNQALVTKPYSRPQGLHLRVWSSLSEKIGRLSSGTDVVRKWVQEKREGFPSRLLLYKEARLREVANDFGEFRVLYDGYWTRFRWKNSDWNQRCSFEEVFQLPSLPECARYCWKLLMFRRKPEDVWESMEYVFPLISRGEISCMKHDADRLIDIGADGYVMVIYTWGEEQRDAVKQRLHATGFTSIPWRRGCKAFERRFGHWKTWFP